MKISRIQIEEGFLNGLDLSPAQGLTVLIGARGTGKTSVIELLRYVLAARSHTKESATRSLEHARAVLGAGGGVTVTLRDEFEEVVVTRGGSDDRPQSTSEYALPIVLSQMEIETLGLSESGRLSLIDGFISGRGELKSEEAGAVAAIRSVCREIESIASETEGLDENAKRSEELTTRLEALKAQQVVIQKESASASAKQEALVALGSETSHLTVKEQALERFEQEAHAWQARLEESLLEDFGPDSWDAKTGDDPLAGLRIQYVENIKRLADIASTFGAMRSSAQSQRKELTVARIEVEKKSRLIRSELEKIAEGSGTLARQVSAIQTQLAQLKSHNQLLSERMTRLRALRGRRNKLIDALDEIRGKRTNARMRVAKDINRALAPHIHIDIEPAAQYSNYRSAIVEALRGSGMRYGDLAGLIAERVSPRELVELAESGGFSEAAELLDIPKDRAARLLGHLKDQGSQDILTADIEDNVRMTLLDGVEYKDITMLSAGQRCTVVLSVVLQHKERTLVIDQPEDHLDNAFIATTVIRALKDRDGGGQVILSTHNANIPVLGNAELVVELTSDGRNGFVEVCEPLVHPRSVEAISSVMEGGREAFRKRSLFYAEHEGA